MPKQMWPILQSVGLIIIWLRGDTDAFDIKTVVTTILFVGMCICETILAAVGDK